MTNSKGFGMSRLSALSGLEDAEAAGEAAGSRASLPARY